MGVLDNRLSRTPILYLNGAISHSFFHFIQNPHFEILLIYHYCMSRCFLILYLCTLFLKRNATFESLLFFGEDCRSVVILKSIPDNVHDPELLTLTQGHQGKWNKKSCVSFEEECSNNQSFSFSSNLPCSHTGLDFLG